MFLFHSINTDYLFYFSFFLFFLKAFTNCIYNLLFLSLLHEYNLFLRLEEKNLTFLVLVREPHFENVYNLSYKSKSYEKWTQIIIHLMWLYIDDEGNFKENDKHDNIANLKLIKEQKRTSRTIIIVLRERKKENTKRYGKSCDVFIH